MFTVVDKQLSSYRLEEQAYKACLSLLKLADTYGTQRLNTACSIALLQVPVLRYKLIHNTLVTKQDQAIEKPPEEALTSSHAVVRGAADYGGNHHGE